MKNTEIVALIILVNMAFIVNVLLDWYFLAIQ